MSRLVNWAGESLPKPVKRHPVLGKMVDQARLELAELNKTPVHEMSDLQFEQRDRLMRKIGTFETISERLSS